MPAKKDAPLPAKKDAPQGASDQTERGGRYVVNDVVVDANGKPLEEQAPAAPTQTDSGAQTGTGGGEEPPKE